MRQLMEQLLAAGVLALAAVLFGAALGPGAEDAAAPDAVPSDSSG